MMEEDQVSSSTLTSIEDHELIITRVLNAFLCI